MSLPYTCNSSGSPLSRVKTTFFADGDFNQTAAVVDVEGIACPRTRQERCEAEFAAPSFHLGETLDDGEPRAGHRSNMQAVFGVVVVVVQVQAGGAPVHFHGFFFFAQFGSEDGVDTWRQRAFMHGHRFVEVEVAAFFVHVETVAEEVDALQYVRLFDEGRTQDFVPRPFLVERQIVGRKRGYGADVFVKEAVVLHEYAEFFVMRTVHIRADVRPFFQLGGAHVRTRTRVFRQGFAGVAQYPCGEGVGLPVVVDVVFVFVRTGYALNHVFAVAFGEVDAVRPEAGHFDQDFQAFFGKIALVTGVVGVVVDGVRNRAVTVDFLEGDFPFVVALDARKRYHRIECARQALFACVMLRLRQFGCGGIAAGCG